LSINILLMGINTLTIS